MNLELSIIFVLINNPEAVLNCDVVREDFASPTLTEAFLVIQAMAISNEKMDIVVLIKSMKSPDAKEVILSIARDGYGVLANLKSYVKEIRELRLKKQLRVFLEETIDDLGLSSVDEVVGGITSKLSSLRNKEVDHAYNGQQMMKKTIEHIDAMHDLKCENRMAGVPSGLDKLDKLLGGFHRSDLIIVGARPSVGKTAWAISCALNAANRGFKVGFISTEMSIVQVGMRVASLISTIPASVMRDSSFDEKDWPKLTAGTMLISKLPFYVFDKPVCKVSDIAMQARAWKSNKGLDILFVDYLTRLKPENSSDNKVIAVGNIATDLKTLARNIDIPVVCLAQVSREADKTSDKKPNMSHLRDSGVIEQEADQILMLYRECIHNLTPQNAEDAEINVEKNRHGAIKGLDMRFKPSTMEWCDKEDFDDYEYR